jgi:hypothetical protein
VNPQFVAGEDHNAINESESAAGRATSGAGVGEVTILHLLQSCLPRLRHVPGGGVQVGAARACRPGGLPATAVRCHEQDAMSPPETLEKMLADRKPLCFGLRLS